MSTRVLVFHYELFDKDGGVMDSSREGSPLAVLEGKQQIIPGLEKAIVEMQVGDQKQVEVPAAEAYGPFLDNLVMDVKRADLPEGEIAVGTQFQGGQDPNSPIFTVKKIEGDTVSLDGNHPLAGKDLTFKVEMTEIREATAEELEHGHVHGPGGHEH